MKRISGKRVQFLKELVPGLARVSVLRNPTVALQAIFWRQTEQQREKFGSGGRTP